MKVKCTERRCGWMGKNSEMAKAINPFPNNNEKYIYACPECMELENSIVVVCDEPGCWHESTCGTPTKKGYRQTCSKHKPN